MNRARFGLFLSTRLAESPGASDPAPFLAQAAFAETTGFDSIWVGDSLVARPRLEPLTLLAALAARTNRVTLGTAVLLPALRHPLTTAHALATIDRLCAGRLVVGVGAGFAYPGTERELALVGVPMKERVSRLTESLAIWRVLWAADGPVSHRGRHWSFSDVELTPRPSRRGGPPVWMGGNAPPAIARAAEIADGFFPTSASPEAFRDAWSIALEIARKKGRAADALAPAVVLTLNVDPDGNRARRALHSYVETYYGAPFDFLSTFIGCGAGDADGCAEWIDRYLQAGAGHVVLRIASANQLEQLERLATEVLPKLGAGARVAPSSVARTYADAWRRGDRETLFNLYAEDVVLHYFGRNPLSGRHAGREQLLRVLAAVEARTTRELVSVEDVLSSDDRAAIVVRERFHRDGRTTEMERVLLYRIAGGRIAECWLYDQDQRAVDALFT